MTEELFFWFVMLCLVAAQFVSAMVRFFCERCSCEDAAWRPVAELEAFMRRYWWRYQCVQLTSNFFSADGWNVSCRVTPVSADVAADKCPHEHCQSHPEPVLYAQWVSVCFEELSTHDQSLTREQLCRPPRSPPRVDISVAGA